MRHSSTERKVKDSKIHTLKEKVVCVNKQLANIKPRGADRTDRLAYKFIICQIITSSVRSGIYDFTPFFKIIRVSRTY